MANFIQSEGFGSDGLAVTSAGFNYRFTRGQPARVLLINKGAAEVYVGYNALIDDADGNAASEPSSGFDWVTHGSVAEVIATGIPLAAGESIVLEGGVTDGGNNDGIYNIWAATAAGDETTIKGGALST